MGSKEQLLKESWFNRGVDAVSWYPPRRLYACPLCMGLFDELSDVTLEHAPPSCFEGSELTLTCWSCNNRGSAVDKELGRYVKLRDFFLGKPGLPSSAVFSMGDSAANITYQNKLDGSGC